MHSKHGASLGCTSRSQEHLIGIVGLCQEFINMDQHGDNLFFELWCDCGLPMKCPSLVACNPVNVSFTSRHCPSSMVESTLGDSNWFA